MTGGGLLLVLAVLVPMVAMMVGMAAGRRYVQWVALLTLPLVLGLSVAIAVLLLQSGETVVYVLGNWSPPLGVALRADPLSAAMLVAVAVVVSGVAVYACHDFPAGRTETRASFSFWLLLLAVWGGLNLVLVAGDLFTLYVALELLTFAAVPLVSLDGRGETLQAALRYLLYALAGSILYLLGAFLLYGACGTLDIPLLATRIQAEPVAWSAIALMTVGLAAKTALFPLHLWLPPAHAGAPAAASAILSALVVKGSWFIVVRLWLDVGAGVVTLSAAQLLGAMGAAAILAGNVIALRQARLKLLVAYSTVAQIGYLFLMFPLAAGLGVPQAGVGAAVAGGLLQAISHATAKAAMFLGAGLIYTTLGHDRMADLRGVGRALPTTLFAFGIAGVSLIGLPPSGGFAAKWLLLTAAADTGQWWWAGVILAGGLLTGAYVYLIVLRAMEPAEAGWAPRAPVPGRQQLPVLALALCSLLLGCAALLPGTGRSDVQGQDAAAVETEIAHQARIGQHEADDGLGDVAGVDLGIGTNIHHRYGSVGAHRPPGTRLELPERVFRHEQVEDRLGPGSSEEADRQGGLGEVPGALAVPAQHAVAMAAADHEPRGHH